MATKDEIVRAFDQEIDRLMKSGMTGDLTVRINFLTGGIAKTSKDIHSALIAAPRGRGPIRGFDEPGKNMG